MGLFDVFRKTPQERRAEEAHRRAAQEDLEVYSGMRVEVSTFDGRILFVAKLMSLWGNTAQLHQYSEAPPIKEAEEGEPFRVRIRGYNDRERKAVYMEGNISPLPQSKWRVEELVVARIGNDRAFFRLDTDLPASISKFSGRSAGDFPCRLLNISVGGACVASEQRYWEGDKFLLSVKLLEDRETSIMYCQVLRVVEKEDAPFEYGCQFLELNDADQDKITENIFAAQLKSRSAPK